MISSVEGAGTAFAAGITAAEDYRQRALERTAVQADVTAEMIGGSTARIAASTQEDLSQAGDAMNRAAQALKRGDLEGARTAQNEALQRLREGAEKMSNQALAEREGRDGRKKQEGQTGELDPLGRQTSGSNAEGADDVSVPTQTERQRAREILDELRRRAGDTTRPEAEREYLKRLLDRFTGS